MAKGARGKGVPKTLAKGTQQNNENNDTNNTKGNKEPKQRNRKKREDEENTKSQQVEVTIADQSANHTTHQPSSTETKKEPVKPTSEQLMIARIVDTNQDDPTQRKKIQMVMEITGKEEDVVATALFDSGWDQNRAVELLIECGEEGMGEWEETGKKKKKKHQAEESKDDWEEETPVVQNDNREKGSRRGNRSRRGGTQSQGGKGARSEATSGDRGESGRGRRGDQSGRRGRGGGRGGNRGGGQGDRSNRDGGFAGSIDTWNPSASGASGGNAAGTSSNGDEKRSRRGNKDAFDNAGNWGDDFPAAEDWDNEEYTGSLADTKVFTNQKTVQSRGNSSTAPTSSAKDPATASSNSFATKAAAPPGSGVDDTRPGQSSAGIVGSGTPNYPHQIDLSTILSKPTTQSAINNTTSQASSSLLQFSSQAATESLKAAVGIGKSSGSTLQSTAQAPQGKTKTVNDLSYPYASSSSTKSSNFSASVASYGTGTTNGDSLGTGKRAPSQQATSSSQVSKPESSGRSRLPPSSKLPVEMPGDALGLDVQFGGLDLQFGGAVNSDTGNVTGSSAFDYVGSAPSAKEVNKSLSNAIGAGGKINAVSDVYETRKQTAPSSRDVMSKSGHEMGSYSNSSYGSYSGGNKASYGQYSSMQYGQSNSGNSYTNGGFSSSNQHQSQSSYTKDQSASFGNYGVSSSSTSSQQQQQTGYKSGGASSGSYSDGVTNKFEPPSASTGASATLGMTTTTNSVSGKVSATSASKMSVPNLPPGVAGLPGLPPQYMISPSMGSMGFYGLQPQGPLYSAYTGLEDLAALQRNVLVGSAAHLQQQNSKSSSGHMSMSSSGGYYDPQFQNISSSNTSAGSSSRGVSSVGVDPSTSSSGSAGVNSPFGDNKGNNSNFGIVSSGNVTDSTNSPIPSTLHQQSAAPAFNLNAFANAAAAAAPSGMPPGYAYFYNPTAMPSMPGYGATTGLYPTMQAVPSGSGTTTAQFQQKNAYNTSYGAYDALGQGQGSKDFTSGYSGSGKGSGGSNAASGSGGSGKVHPYWGSTALSNGQLW